MKDSKKTNSIKLPAKLVERQVDEQTEIDGHNQLEPEVPAHVEGSASSSGDQKENGSGYFFRFNEVRPRGSVEQIRAL